MNDGQPRRGRRVGYGVAVAVLALSLPAAFLNVALADDADDTVTDVYLSADDGDDDASGGVDDPLATLAGVRDLLAGIESDEARIHIDPGEYRETRRIDWDDVPQDRLSFESTGTGDDRPIFDGRDVQANRDEHYWMRTDGGPSLDIDGLLIRNYGTGAVLAIGVDNNSVTHTVFERIGNSYIHGTDGYGALHLKGSSHNTLSHNDFRDLQNNDDREEDGCPGCIHAIYLARSSNDNTITDSTFDDITGDPVRLVDDVNDTDVTGNTFRTSGNEAMVSFWRFHDGDDCGTGNDVHDNRYNAENRDGDEQPITKSGTDNDDLPVCEDAVSDEDNDVID